MDLVFEGVVRTRSSLDREEQAVYTLEITARNDTRSSKTLVVINIGDLNDHGPQFSKKHYQVRIHAEGLLGLVPLSLVLTSSAINSSSNKKQNEEMQ